MKDGRISPCNPALSQQYKSLAVHLTKWVGESKSRHKLIYQLMKMANVQSDVSHLHALVSKEFLVDGSMQRYVGIVSLVDSNLQNAYYIIYPDGDTEWICLEELQALLTTTNISDLSSYTPPIATNKTLHKKKLHQTNRECIKAFQTQHASCIDNATIDFFSNLWLITDERADLDVLPEVYDRGTGFVLFTTMKPCTYGHAKDDRSTLLWMQRWVCRS